MTPHPMFYDGLFDNVLDAMQKRWGMTEEELTNKLKENENEKLFRDDR